MESIHDVDYERLAAEIAQSNRRRRSQKRWFVIGSVAVLLTALIVAGSMFFTSHGDVIANQSVLPTENLPPPGPELDGYIQRMEQTGRATSDPVVYQNLSQAFEKRFQATHQSNDNERAAEAAGRAQRYASHAEKVAKRAWPGMAFLVAAPVIAILGVLLFLGNRLSREDEACDLTWAQVQAQLQRRLNLLPELVKIVQNYAKHEIDTYLGVIAIRKPSADARHARLNETSSLLDFAQDQMKLAAAAERLLALSENYPELRASPLFMRLQEQWERAENMLLAARQSYNRAVGTYNTSLRLFPLSISAILLGFEPRQYFEAPVEAGDTSNTATHENAPSEGAVP